MNKKHKLLLLVLGGLVLMGGLLLWHLALLEERTEIVFLNVGQGDAILIMQGRYQVLIDGGRTSKELLGRLGRHVPFWDRKIEVVLATHPDADHIGGLPALLRAYDVDQVLTTGAQSETETSRQFQLATRENTGQDPRHIFRGAKIVFPKGGELMVEYPLAPMTENVSDQDTNEGSVVARFTYGETSFLLTGDLPREEAVLVHESPVTVLKVAHHGSRYSSSAPFLEQIRPQEAVVSVGKNSYGHPDSEVLERLQKIGAVIRRTDEVGDIRYRCFEQRCVYAAQ